MIKALDKYVDVLWMREALTIAFCYFSGGVLEKTKAYRENLIPNLSALLCV